MSIRNTETKRRSEPIASNRPESRGLHPVGALARTHRKKDLPRGGNNRRKIQRTYRVIAVDLLEVLCHGDGEVPRPMERRVHRTVGSNGKSVRSVGLLANVASTAVLGPELVRRAHQHY